MRIALKYSAFLVIIVAGGWLVRGWWREHLFHMTASGAMGCGVGTVRVRMHNGDRECRVGLDTVRLIGRDISDDDLILRLERRVAKMPTGSPIWRDHRHTRDEYEVMLSAELLIQLRHPRALPLFIRLLDDALFLPRASEWLAELGDERACPALMDSWDRHPDYPYLFINAFQRFRYRPSIPRIIEVFHMNMTETDLSLLVSTLEMISGDDLDRFRHRRLNTTDATATFKKELHEWWLSNEHQAATKAEQNGCRQRLEGYLSCIQRPPLAVA